MKITMPLKITSLVLLAIMLIGCGSGEATGNRAASSPAPGSDAMMETASAPAEGSTGGGFTSAIANRQIIVTGDLTVRVDDVSAAEKRAEQLVKTAGGFVSNMDSNKADSKMPRSTMTFRVPAGRYDGVLDQLAGMGTELQRGRNADDVTDQLVDMEANLRALRAQENSYLRILDRATKITDILEIQGKLTEIRTMIERLDAQRASLKDRVAYSTLTLTLTQTAENAPETDPNWFGETWSSATTALQSTLKGLATMGIWLFVYLPIWGTIIGAIVWFTIWSGRKSKRSEPKPPATR